MNKYTITLIPGDGIGPEVAIATTNIVDATGLNITWETVNAGEAVFNETGTLIPDAVYKSIEKNKVALKGPITTPIGKGFRSVNVYLRKKYDLYTNIRPITNTFKKIDNPINMIIFRENTEGLYIGIEKMVTKDHAESTKKITREGSTRIIRKAFEYAKDNNLNKVTVAHKANILKFTDGLFLDVAREISKEYGIFLEEVIVDNMCMQMVMNPTQFGLIVTMNLYGDILSDLGAGLVGGLGLIPGANIGDDIAIFEAVHGSAPDIAGKNLANPIALTRSAVMMLNYLGETKAGTLIGNAVDKVLFEGIVKTKDLGGNNTTKEMEQAIIAEIKRSC
ncbi:MAG: isocitrate/isopropylmalate dehydrogenase family protein [Candidatus Izemoplasma sp.]